MSLRYSMHYPTARSHKRGGCPVSSPCTTACGGHSKKNQTKRAFIQWQVTSIADGRGRRQLENQFCRSSGLLSHQILVPTDYSSETQQCQGASRRPHKPTGHGIPVAMPTCEVSVMLP